MNFYTFVKYFWVIAFVVSVLHYMLSWDVQMLWRMAITLFMIIVFSAADSLTKDRKILVNR